MNIKPLIKTFHILPFISIKKYENPLTDKAKRDFGYNWKPFRRVEIGWLFWKIEL